MSELGQLLNDPRIEAVLERAYTEWSAQRGKLALRFLPLVPQFLGLRRFDWEGMLERTRDLYLPLDKEQGGLLYLTARAISAKRAVEFGTSFGVSALYLAAAIRETGGTVIGTEILPEKAERARANFEEAGVASWIDLRVGDARETLKDCGGPVDLLLLDGWKDIELDVLKVVEPQLRPGALLFVDNVDTFKVDNRELLAYRADPESGYRSMLLPLKDGMQMAIYDPA